MITHLTLTLRRIAYTNHLKLIKSNPNLTPRRIDPTSQVTFFEYTQPVAKTFYNVRTIKAADWIRFEHQYKFCKLSIVSEFTYCHVWLSDVDPVNIYSTPSQILHTGSLFSSQPHQNNSIFGSSGLNQGAGLFGLQNNNAPQEQSGSIFGGQSTQPQAASIFAPESSQQQSRGLFGGIPTQKPQSQIGGLIPSFGQNQTQAQAQNQTQLGGLFGASDRNKSTSML